MKKTFLLEDIQIRASYTRLARLLKQRFDKNVELLDFTDVNNLDQQYAKDLIVSLRHEDLYLGTAIVANGQLLSHEEQGSIESLVKLVLEPTLYGRYRNLAESNNKTMLGFLSIVDSESPQPLTDAASLVEAAPAGHSPFSDRLVALQGTSPTRMHQVALEVHELSGGWAFFPWQDISKNLEVSKDIRDFGATTIFINDIFELCANDVQLLTSYLKSMPDANNPLIILGCSVSLPQLHDRGIETDFLEFLTSTWLTLDKLPFKTDALREALSMLFLESQSFSHKN